MSLWPKLVILLAVFVAGGMAAHKYDTGQFALKEAARIEVTREAERINRVAELNHSQTVIKASNDSRIRETKARSDAAGAMSERARLRDEINAIRANMPGLSADACRERASAVSELFDQCVGAYQSLAGKADRHASDTLTLEQAWPK